MLVSGFSGRLQECFLRQNLKIFIINNSLKIPLTILFYNKISLDLHVIIMKDIVHNI